ncbi:MAG TPA: LuxR C-terminal-related transcriptional regulator, partial [Ruania sp.]|nr:LuxR C-terminal-related transcriptional regulator [Ruania sp.]
LHWADASTRDLLTFLLARMSDEALTVVLTYRSDELHRRHPLRPLVTELGRMRRVERLTLDPFAPAQAREFARAVAAAQQLSIDESVITGVAERSEGNAFFAEELLGHDDDAALAGPLGDVLLGRIERLGADAQRVVRVASVAGQQRIRHASLRTVTGLDDDALDTALRECVNRYVLVVAPDETYEFRHSLLREAVYADLLPGERRRVHAAFVELLGQAQHPGWRGAQAHHATQAGDLATALQARIGAAADATQVGATSDVLHHLEEALALWEAVADPHVLTGTDELSLTIRAADAAVAAGRPERAEAFLASALQLADAGTDVVAQAAVRRRMATARYADEDTEGGRELISQAWELIRDTPPSAERAWVLATRAFGEVFQDSREAAEAAIADAREVGDGGAEADALISLSYQLVRSGEHERAMTVLDEARTRAAQVGAFEVELRAYFNLTVGEFEYGRIVVAAEHARHGLERARAEGLVWATYGRELAWIAIQVLYAAGAWDEVAELTSPPGERAPDWLSTVIAEFAALLAASRGDWDEAEEQLRSDADRSHAGEPMKILAYAIAEIGLGVHNEESVVSRLTQGITEIRANEDEPPLSLLRIGTLGISAAANLAARARQSGNLAEEEQAVQAAEQFFAHVADARDHGQARGATWGPEARAWLARGEGELARAHGSMDPHVWRTVMEAFSYGDVYQYAIGQWRLAEALLLAHEDLAEADGLLAKALATGRELKAAPLIEELELVARRHRRRVAGVQMAAADLLTPREKAVLDLVARGLTNRAAGKELFISEKTVSVHVSRAMAKLEAHSRTEAVAIALREGLITG